MGRTRLLSSARDVQDRVSCGGRLLQLLDGLLRREDHEFDLAALAAASPNFSGAELEQAIISALFDAFHAQQPLSTMHVLAALRETVPLAKTMAETITAQREWASGRARLASSARDLEA